MTLVSRFSSSAVAVLTFCVSAADWSVAPGMSSAVAWGGVVTDTPNVKAATAQTATVRLSPSSSFLGYFMVPPPSSNED